MISCPTTSFCGAASSALTPGDAEEGTPATPVLLTLSGGTWSSQVAPLPSTAGSGTSDFDNVNGIVRQRRLRGGRVLRRHVGCGAGPLGALVRQRLERGERAASLEHPDAQPRGRGRSRVLHLRRLLRRGRPVPDASRRDPAFRRVDRRRDAKPGVRADALGRSADAGRPVERRVLRGRELLHGGRRVPPSGADRAAGLIDQLAGSTWSAVPAPTPSNTESPAEVSLGAVSCSGRGACGAAGTYVAQGPLTEGLLEAYTPAEGYWSVAADGGVFTYDAVFHGSMGGRHINAPVVGMAETPGAGGYWEAGADGGVYNFGNAAFYGSAGSLHLNAPVVGIAATPDGQGYWLVAADGGIFNYGDAGFFGSRGGQPLNKPIVGMAATPDGGGYWLVAADGGIFNYGDAPFYGSRGGQPLNKPVVGIAAKHDGPRLLARGFRWRDLQLRRRRALRLPWRPAVEQADRRPDEHLRRSRILARGVRRRDLQLRRRRLPGVGRLAPPQRTGDGRGTHLDAAGSAGSRRTPRPWRHARE